MAAKQEEGDKAEHVDILANAAAEASKPGADTESQYECPFCVMMRKGGCEDVFKAFMECGEKADKGDMEMADCLPQFEQLHLCMEKNKAVFDGLLQEMKEEEERSKAAAAAAAAAAGEGGSSSSAEQQQQSSDSAAGVTTHQQEGSGPAAVAAAAVQSGSSSGSIEQTSSSQLGAAAAAAGMAAAS